MKNKSTEEAGSLFFDNFSNNNSGWEITNSDSETAIINENGYQLTNHTSERWMRYTLFPKIGDRKNLLIQCELEIDEHSDLGQIGILWGFNESHTRLNRFCISSSGNGCTIMHFNNNHRPVFFRFFDPFFSIDKNSGLAIGESGLKRTGTRKVSFEIRECNNYFFFRINKKLAYIGHVSHFADMGEGVGFYVDPGVSATIKKLKISRLTSSKAFSLN